MEGVSGLGRSKIIFCNLAERIITIHNENLLYAFKHGEKMLMIKEKYETSESGYTFISIKNNAGNIMVAAQGTTDTTKDLFGRNDWNFTIDFNNFYVERKAITQ